MPASLLGLERDHGHADGESDQPGWNQHAPRRPAQAERDPQLVLLERGVATGRSEGTHHEDEGLSRPEQGREGREPASPGPPPFNAEEEQPEQTHGPAQRVLERPAGRDPEVLTSAAVASGGQGGGLGEGSLRVLSLPGGPSLQQRLIRRVAVPDHPAVGEMRALAEGARDRVVAELVGGCPQETEHDEDREDPHQAPAVNSLGQEPPGLPDRELRGGLALALLRGHYEDAPSRPTTSMARPSGSRATKKPAPGSPSQGTSCPSK